MNNVLRFISFFLIFLLYMYGKTSFGQVSHVSKNTTQKDSLKKQIPKGFRLSHDMKITNYDTVVVLNKNLLALGKGKTEKYREYTVLNKSGKTLFEKASFFGDFNFKEGAIPIVTRSGEGFLLETGRVPFRCTLWGSENFMGGIAHIVVNGKLLPGIDYSYQDPPPSRYHNWLGHNPFHALDNYVNRKFELMIPKYYDSIVPYREGRIRMVMKKGLFGFLDTTGREVIAPTLSDFDGDDQYSWQHLRRVQDKGMFGFVDDRSGQQIIPFEYEATVASIYPFTWVRKAGKWGCINQSGTHLIPFLYDTVSYFDADSISLAGRNGRMGHIRANGSIVTPLLYESAKPFAEGLALVSQGGRYGYVNQKGQLTIPAVYTSATSFRHGYASVERFGIKAIIDKQGYWTNYRLGTGWNLSIVLFFLLFILVVASWRRVF